MRKLPFTTVAIWFNLRVYSILCGLLAANAIGTGSLNIWERWDAVYYTRIVADGYSATNSTTNFHPLFSWLSRPAYALGFAPIVSLLLVASLSTLLLYFVFEKLALIDQEPSTAKTSTILFLSWPISYILYLPYSESLWLLLAALCFLFSRQRRWWAAGLAAGLATLTRQQGLFLIVPMGWELWASARHNICELKPRWRDLLSLTMIPLAYAGWIAYRTFAVGDTKPDLSSVRGMIGSALLSPARHQIVKDNQFMWPWKAAYLAIKRALELPYANPWVDLMFGFLFIILVVVAWSYLRTSYRLFVLVIVVASVSFHTGMTPTGGAYLSLPRHLLLAFPVFIGLGARWPNLKASLLITIGTLTMTLLLLGYFWVRLVP